ATRHKHHFPYGACNGHVNAVIVIRGKINCRELSTNKWSGQVFAAAHQRLQTEVVALGLVDAIIMDLAELTESAVHRGGKAVRCCIDGAGVVLEGAGKKVIEGRVGLGATVDRLAHVYSVALDKPADKRVLDRGQRTVGEQPGRAGNTMLGCQ